MKTEALNYNLPPELIAQQPIQVRSDSRLLVINRSGGEFLNSQFNKIGDFLLPGDCLVLNDTQVLPARFFARRGSGARLEGLFLSESGNTWTVYLKGTRKIKTGETLYLKDMHGNDFCQAVLLEKMEEGKCRIELKIDAVLRTPHGEAKTTLEKIGFPPLPPYIKRDDDPEMATRDKQRYQTVYARQSGAVAAPTAGLHFTEQLIEQLKQAGILFANITLHVGAGTFKPVTAENIEEHQIHKERFSIDEKNAQIINQAKNNGGRIIPVGTTSTRVLETVARNSQIEAAEGLTDLFIKPGYKFKITDAMITNFHLPKSTLLALVAAFAGLDKILSAYQHAIEQKYRFYSYGDAMLIV